jgi:hypothetical protein
MMKDVAPGGRLLGKVSVLKKFTPSLEKRICDAGVGEG